jgi:hypothetical protein
LNFHEIMSRRVTEYGVRDGLGYPTVSIDEISKYRSSRPSGSDSAVRTRSTIRAGEFAAFDAALACLVEQSLATDVLLIY